MAKTEVSAKDILHRFEILKEERRDFEPVWRTCEWNLASILQDWDGEKPKSPYMIPRRITNQPANFLNTCITGVAGYAMSPNIKWFKLALQDQALNNASGVRQWLEQCEGLMRRIFERCGFYQKGLRWLELACIYGHSAMLIEETRNADTPLRYCVPEVHELYFDNNDAGETEVVFRSYWTGVENAVNHYGLKAMHDDIKMLYERSQGDDAPAGLDLDIHLLHAVYLRRSGPPATEELAANKKWASVIVDVKNKHIIKETGYDDFPYAVFFWERIGKPYGVSPAMKASNDIALYQTVMEETLKVAQYSANPAKIVAENLRGKENFKPGGINYVRSMEQAPQQLAVGANYPITIQVAQMLEQHVKSWFNVDFFLMLRNTQNVQNMTATAVAALQGEQVALLSALVSNLFDGLNRVIQRTFNILAKRRLLPPLPFALQQMGGSLQVEFQGVLAQAQKAAYEYQGLNGVFGVAAQTTQFAEVSPEWGQAINWIKSEALFKRIIESLGAPADILRTQEEYDELMNGAAAASEEAAARQSQAQEAQAVLQNAQNLNQRVAPGSMLEGLLSKRR